MATGAAVRQSSTEGLVRSDVTGRIPADTGPLALLRRELALKKLTAATDGAGGVPCDQVLGRTGGKNIAATDLPGYVEWDGCGLPQGHAGYHLSVITTRTQRPLHVSALC